MANAIVRLNEVNKADQSLVMMLSLSAIMFYISIISHELVGYGHSGKIMSLIFPSCFPSLDPVIGISGISLPFPTFCKSQYAVKIFDIALLVPNSNIHSLCGIT